MLKTGAAERYGDLLFDSGSSLNGAGRIKLNDGSSVNGVGGDVEALAGLSS